MNIYTVYITMHGYDVNMLVKAKSAKQARDIAKQSIKLETVVTKVNEAFIEDMELEKEYASLRRKRNGSFVIYDEGT